MTTMESNSDAQSGSLMPPYRVAEWHVDPASNLIVNKDHEVRLEPKVMRVLGELARRSGQVVSREELEDLVWGNVIVGPDALTNSIIKLRKAFGDDAKNPSYIETIPKTGYRLIAPVHGDNNSTGPPLKRKLCAVLYADVEGYSRLTGNQEEATHRVLRSHLDFFSRTINSHGGSVVHYAGDAVLAEFNTVSEALGCAVAVQDEFNNKATDTTHQPVVRFRIGVNLGEVIVDRDDIFGDGVNIAVRLESLADPGGICISESVKAAVGNKLALHYEFMGEKQVKNIREPIRAYRVENITTKTPNIKPAAPRHQYLRHSALALTIFVIGSIVVWLLIVDEKSTTPRVTKKPLMQELVTNHSLGKPVIGVLPFANVSVKAEDEYMADGLTDDIITDLSRISGLDVIARSSVFTFKNKAINLDEIRAELGVDFVLEGSVRQVGENIRINVQLVDAATGRHVWAERFDGAYQEFFALQDSVITHVVSAVSVNLTDSEIARIERPPTNSLEAYDAYLRAEQAGYFGSHTDLNTTMALYRRAIQLDPRFSEAYAGLARSAVEAWRLDLSDIIQGGQARDIAYRSASKALEIDPGNGRAYSVLAILQLAEHQHEVAIQSARKAVELSPGQAQSHLDLGLVLTLSGQPELGHASIQAAFRLNPKPSADTLLYAAIVEFYNEQFSQAVEHLTSVREVRKNSDSLWTYLAAAYAMLGAMDEAKTAARGLFKLYPNSSIEYMRVLHSYIRKPEFLDMLLQGLKQAGIPVWAFGIDADPTDRLDQAELEQLTLGQTWAGSHLNGTGFFLQVSETGVLAYRSQNSLQSGTASVRDAMLCQRFDHTTLNQDLCGYIYRNPEGSAEERNEYLAILPNTVHYFSVVTN